MTRHASDLLALLERQPRRPFRVPSRFQGDAREPTEVMEGAVPCSQRELDALEGVVHIVKRQVCAEEVAELGRFGVSRAFSSSELNVQYRARLFLRWVAEGQYEVITFDTFQHCLYPRG
jgi:hypothetical protein